MTTKQFSTVLGADGWVPELSGPDGVIVINMASASYPLDAAEAANGAIVTIDSGDGTKSVVFPASSLNSSKYKVINAFGGPVLLDSGEGRKVVCFLRADVLYALGYGFFNMDGMSICASDSVEVTTSADTTEQIIKQQVLPAMSFEKDGDSINIKFAVNKSDVATTETLRLRLGVLGTIVDLCPWSDSALATTNDAIYAEVTISRYNNTTFRVVSAPYWHTPTGVSGTTVSDFTVPDMDTHNLYLSLTGQNDTGAETVTCKFWEVSIKR